ISPNSTRNPRIFTCWSCRPRNSNCPSARHRTRSPVRYSRPPGSNLLATNRSAVSSSCPQYPPPTPPPPLPPPPPPPIPPRQTLAPNVQLSRYPHRHHRPLPIQHVHPRVGNRPPDRRRPALPSY